MMDIEVKDSILSIINDFFFNIPIDRVYNEISLQLELGCRLRNRLDERYRVEFERNVSHFDLKGIDTKKEIDIVIYDKHSKICAIELKYPTNNQVPEQMYSFCKDIRFLEELVIPEKRFSFGFFIVLAGDYKFYSDNLRNDGIYSYFRRGETIKGKIFKPTGEGKDKNFVALQNSYKASWIDTAEVGLKYCLIEVSQGI